MDPSNNETEDNKPITKGSDSFLSNSDNKNDENVNEVQPAQLHLNEIAVEIEIEDKKPVNQQGDSSLATLENRNEENRKEDQLDIVELDDTAVDSIDDVSSTSTSQGKGG